MNHLATVSLQRPLLSEQSRATEQPSNSASPIQLNSKAFFESYRAGNTISTIAEETNLPKSKISQLIKEYWYEKLSVSTAEFLPAKDLDGIAEARIFRSKLAWKLIMTAKCPINNESKPSKIPADVAPELKYLYQGQLLSREQEFFYFRQLHFLRNKMQAVWSSMDSNRVTLKKLGRCAALCSLAEDVRNKVIIANQRLIVAYVKNKIAHGQSLSEAVSELQPALNKAIRGFDHTKGNKFSTYATYALMSQFARLDSRQNLQNNRFISNCEHEKVTDITPQDEYSAKLNIESAHKLVGLLSELDQREASIIKMRFGIAPYDRVLTLREVGGELGVTKERVRQIEMSALNKIRYLAELQVFE